jgi:hypothetical protein
MCLRFLEKSVLQLLDRTVYKLAFKLKKLKTSVDNSVHSVSIKCIKTFLKRSWYRVGKSILLTRLHSVYRNSRCNISVRCPPHGSTSYSRCNFWLPISGSYTEFRHWAYASSLLTRELTHHTARVMHARTSTHRHTRKPTRALFWEKWFNILTHSESQILRDFYQVAMLSVRLALRLKKQLSIDLILRKLRAEAEERAWNQEYNVTQYITTIQ